MAQSEQAISELDLLGGQRHPVHLGADGPE